MSFKYSRFIDQSEKYLTRKQILNEDKKFLRDGRKSYNSQGFTDSEKVQRKLNSQERENHNFVENEFQKFIQSLPNTITSYFKLELDKYHLSRVSHRFPKRTFEKLPLEKRFTVCNVCFEHLEHIDHIEHIISYQPTISSESFFDNYRLEPTFFSFVNQKDNVSLFSYVNGVGKMTFIIFHPDVGYVLPSVWMQLHKNPHQAFTKLANIDKKAHRCTKTVKDFLGIENVVRNLQSFKTSDLY